MSVADFTSQVARGGDRSLHELLTAGHGTKLIIPVILVVFCFWPGTQLSFASAPQGQVNITVALDGSGQFRSVQEAIMSVPAGSPAKPVVIRIKPGTYKELIYIQ